MLTIYFLKTLVSEVTAVHGSQQCTHKEDNCHRNSWSIYHRKKVSEALLFTPQNLIEWNCRVFALVVMSNCTWRVFMLMLCSYSYNLMLTNENGIVNWTGRNNNSVENCSQQNTKLGRKQKASHTCIMHFSVNTFYTKDFCREYMSYYYHELTYLSIEHYSQHNNKVERI